MTLTEYLNQTEPKRKPYVTLEPNEYKLGLVLNGFRPNSGIREKTTKVFISDESFIKEFGIVEYILIGSTLYTTDGHGNAKAASVFRV